MKVYLRLVLGILLSSSLVFAKKTNVDFLNHYIKLSREGDVSYLLSYPRSGNTLVRYIFEFVTGRPTMQLSSHHDLINIFLNYSLKELEVDLYAKPLWKVHRNLAIQAQGFYKFDRTILVLLVRNYKEIALRYSQFRDLPLFDESGQLIEDNLKLAFSIWDKDDERELYFQNIAYFDTLPQDKRLLIYYEDLMQYPEHSVEQITDFFGGSRERMQKLLADYDYYKDRIHTFYDKEETALSNVGDVRFYSHRFTSAQRRSIDNWVKEHHADLWPYLARYEEQGEDIN